MASLVDWLMLFSLQLAVPIVVAAIGEACIAMPAAVRLTYWRAVLCATLLLAAPSAMGVSLSTLTVDARSVVSVVTALETVDPSWRLSDIMLVVWLGGVVASATWLAVGLLALGRLRTTPDVRPVATTLNGPDAPDLKRVGIWWHPSITHPVSFGIRRPLILLPLHARTLPREALEAVIHHEALHVARRDWAWQVAEELVRAVLWFHPGIWWAIDRLRLSREETIDAVVAPRHGRRIYMETLMQLAEASPRPVPAAGFGRRHLVRRMRALAARAPAGVYGWRDYIAPAGLLVASLVGASCLSGQQQVYSPEDEGVSLPSVIREVQPVYTQAAMEAGIEGDMLLTAVVRPDGTVGQIDVVDSLDAAFGLDESAVEAAGQWRFEPGTVDGEPVAVKVKLEFRFALDP